MFGISSGNFVSASNVLSHFQNQRAARFHERRPNSIQYESPEFADFTLGVQYGPDEAKGNPGVGQDAKWWSYGIKYEREKFNLSVQQEIHYDTFGGSANIISTLRNGTTSGTGGFTADASANSKDTATRFSAEFKPGAHRFTVDVAQIEYKESSALAAPRFSNYKHVNWAVGWEAQWGGGPWKTAVQYVKAAEGSCSLTGGASCSTSGLGAYQVSLGVAYNLSKRTMLFAIGAQLENDRAAAYDNFSNAQPGVGADITQWALGVSHSF
jgi:predicted porin